jgi:hypothetical protein
MKKTESALKEALLAVKAKQESIGSEKLQKPDNESQE